MSTKIITFRLEKKQYEDIKTKAVCTGKTHTEIIRQAIDEVLVIGYDLTTKEEAIKTVKWLRGRIKYLRTKDGLQQALKEKEARERIAKRIIKVFELEKQ